MSIGSELLRYQKDQVFMCWDFETESLNLHSTKPWECAWLIGKFGEIIEAHDKFPWFPDLKVSPAAARITRFDFAEYKEKSQDPMQVLLEFEKVFLDKSIIKFGQNIFGFDIFVYNSWRRALGLPVNYNFLYESIFLDTSNLAKAQKKGINIPNIYTHDHVAFNYKMAEFHEKNLKTNLTLLGKQYNIDFDYESAHRGINDIKLNKLVFDKMVWNIEI